MKYQSIGPSCLHHYIWCTNNRHALFTDNRRRAKEEAITYSDICKMLMKCNFKAKCVYILRSLNSQYFSILSKLNCIGMFQYFPNKSLVVSTQHLPQRKLTERILYFRVVIWILSCSEFKFNHVRKILLHLCLSVIWNNHNFSSSLDNQAVIMEDLQECNKNSCNMEQ